MDEKDYEELDSKENQELTSDNDESLEEKDGVKYETNDNWTFDAAAPSLDENIVLEDDNFKIDISNDGKSKEKSKSKSDKIIAEEEIAQGAPTPKKSGVNKETLKFVPLAVFVAAVIAVLSVLGVRYYTVPNGKEGEMMNPGSVIAVVDGTKVSTGMFNYYYSSIISYYEQYANYGYFELDTTIDYALQNTTDEDGNTVTWQDFFKNECLKEIETTTAYYSQGIEAGVTLTKTQKETIDSQIKTLKTSASEAGVSLNDYISANFGEYCTEDTLRLMLEQYYITANYKGMLSADSKFTDKEINAYYKENVDDLSQLEFSYLAFSYDVDEDGAKDKALKNAKSYMKKMTDADSVTALVPEVYADLIKNDAQQAMSSDDSLTEKKAVADATATYEQSTVATITGAESPFDDEITKWLFSSDTKVGSTNYYIDESGYIYAILKTENASVDKSTTYTVRHILIMPESEDASSDDSTTKKEYTKEEWAAAEKEANKVLKKYNDGDKTEYSFALLAEEYSTDTASTSASSSDKFGGLYEGVTEGEMVPAFEEWSLDKSRKYGDTEIVKSDYGYHIMFFISAGEKYKSDIISALKAEKADAVVENSDSKVYDYVVENAIKLYKEGEEAKKEASQTTTDTTDTTTE